MDRDAGGIQCVAQRFEAKRIRDCCDADVRDVRDVEPQILGEWSMVQFVMQLRYLAIAFIGSKKHVVVVVILIVTQHCITT